MKKLLSLTILTIASVTFVFGGSASAVYDPSYDMKTNQERFEEAITLRQSLSRKNAIRARYNLRNLYTQRYRHRTRLRQNHVDGNANIPNREGELQDFDGVRETTPYRLTSNSKANFTKRVMCYYVENGYANAECMSRGGVDGETNVVSRRANRFDSPEVAAIRRATRELSKAATFAPNYDFAQFRPAAHYQTDIKRSYDAPFVKQFNTDEDFLFESL